MRALILAAALSVAAGASAFADESIAGKWRANLGSGVTINMNVTPDNGWTSETRQKNELVRRMKGTYKQMPAENGTGTLIFTPTQSDVKTGKVDVETDQYELASNGRQLKLTSNGDTMVFEKSRP